MPKAYCPNCDVDIVIDHPNVGTMIKCHECDTELEIISASPFEVDFPLDYGEDWDDDDWDDEAWEGEGDEEDE